MFDFARKADNAAVYEAMSDLDVTDDIKDEFLDDPEVMAIGAENDPKITALIDKIPPDDEADEPTQAEIDKITEAMWDPDSEENIDDKITDEDFSEFDEYATEEKCGESASDDFSEFDEFSKSTEDYESEGDSAIEDRISNEDFSEFDGF